MDILTKLKTSLISYYQVIFSGENEDQYLHDVNKINTLVFSDTILVTLPFSEDIMKESDYKNYHWLLFVYNATMLYRHLFDSGLPVRGAIAYGKFLIHDYCFAGQSIIDAYKLTQRLDFAGVVFDKTVPSEVFEEKYLRTFVHKFLVPLKGTESEVMVTLPPSILKFPNKIPSDICQYIAEAFWKHNKDLPPNSIKKIENTELYFRFFKMKQPELFKN